MRIDARTILFSLFLCVFTVFCYVANKQDMLLNWLGIVIYLYGLATWHWTSKDELFSLYSVFWSFLFVFSFGQCVMWAFHIGLDSGIGSAVLFYGTGYIPSQAEVVAAKWYTCISMLSFHITALLFTAKARSRSSHQEHKSAADSAANRKTLFYAGAITTTIIAPIVMVQKVVEAITAARYGYAALYYGAYATQGGYLQIISFLFFPGLIALLVGSGFSKVANAQCADHFWCVCIAGFGSR